MAELINSPKEKMVQTFFNDIARKYDLMNTIISLGRHNRWRKITVIQTALKEGETALDVCCGTGVITMDLARQVGSRGKVVGLDFSENMLEVARENVNNLDIRENIEFIQGNAMDLPFPDNTFDCATVGYGLRNVPDMKKALKEMFRVVKPGGRVVSLEFAKPYLPVFKQVYKLYLNNWIPLMGKIILNNENAYQYLHDSIMEYPHQTEVTRIFGDLGFTETRCFELTWGVAAVHVGKKPGTPPVTVK